VCSCVGWIGWPVVHAGTDEPTSEPSLLGTERRGFPPPSSHVSALCAPTSSPRLVGGIDTVRHLLCPSTAPASFASHSMMPHPPPLQKGSPSSRWQGFSVPAAVGCPCPTDADWWSLDSRWWSASASALTRSTGNHFLSCFGTTDGPANNPHFP
jgi:hypothetical protein